FGVMLGCFVNLIEVLGRAFALAPPLLSLPLRLLHLLALLLAECMLHIRCNATDGDCGCPQLRPADAYDLWLSGQLGNLLAAQRWYLDAPGAFLRRHSVHLCSPAL